MLTTISCGFLFSFNSLKYESIYIIPHLYLETHVPKRHHGPLNNAVTIPKSAMQNLDSKLGKQRFDSSSPKTAAFAIVTKSIFFHCRIVKF